MKKIRTFIHNNLRGIGAFILPPLFVVWAWALSLSNRITNPVSTDNGIRMIDFYAKNNYWNGTSLAIFIISLILFVLIGIFLWRFKPVKRDRYLFAKSGWWMVFAACCFILFLLAIIIAIVIVFNISCIYIEDPVRNHGLVWEVLSQFLDPGNIYHSERGSSAFIAIISAFTGIICISVFLVSSCVNLIAQTTQRWRKGLIHYKYGFKNYIVIIGINEQTANIIHNALREKSVDYILVQTRKDVEKERAKIELKLEKWEEEKIVFYYGERTLYEDIKDLRLENAKEIYVLGEDMNYDNEQDHDSYNITCLEHISEYLKILNGKKHKKYSFGEKLRCHVELEYQSTFTAIKTTPMYRTLNEGFVEFIPFNIHEIWAKKVLIYNCAVYKRGKLNKVQKYIPIDDNITINDSRTVHLVVIGMNQMGVALAMQAAIVTHLPNFVRDKRLRTTITFIDNDAVQESEFLMGRFAELFELCRYRTIVCRNDYFDRHDCIGSDGDIVWKSRVDNRKHNWCDPMTDEQSAYKHLGDNFMDVQWEFIEGNVASKDIQEYISAISSNPSKICTIAVCFNDPQKSLATALYLPKRVYDGALQILVYQKNSFDLVSTIATKKEEWKKYEKLRPFGITEGCYNENSFDNYMAMFVNYTYRHPEVSFSDDIMQEAKKLWPELDMEYKLANISMVDSIPSKWRSLGGSRTEQLLAFRDETNVDLLAEAEHNRWLTERLTMGYRPLISEEWYNAVNFLNDDINSYLVYKEKLKSESRIHFDICPYHLLQVIDPITWDKQNDKAIVSALAVIESLTRQLIIDDLFRVHDNLNIISSIVQNMESIEVPLDYSEGQECQLRSFMIGKKLITRHQWKIIMGQLPEMLKNSNEKDDTPITYVSKEMVDEFIAILHDKVKLLDFRLPWMEESLFVKTHKYSTVCDRDGYTKQWTQSRYENQWRIYGDENNEANLVEYSGNLGFRLVLPSLFSIPNRQKI